MNIIKRVGNMFTEKSEARAKRAHDEKMKALMDTAKDAVQIREFNKKLYICVNNVPYICEDSLHGSIVDEVLKARSTAVVFKME